MNELKKAIDKVARWYSPLSPALRRKHQPDFCV